MSEKESSIIKTVPSHGSQTNDDYEIGETIDELQIDAKEEAKVLRKLDLRIMPILCLVYFISFLDRSNLGNARVVGLEKQLGLTDSQFSAAVSVFYATYITVELPGALLVKRVGPKRYITFVVLCWSLVVLFTCFVRHYGTLLLCRLLLGLFEGSVFPSQSLYITMTYKKEEQTKRLGYLYVCSCISGAFGGLIATGITKIKPRGNFLNWSWLFVIEGCFSIVVGIIVFLFLPNEPKDATFFNEKERQIMLVREKQQKKYLGNAKFEKKEFFFAAKDPKVWLSAATQFCLDTVLYGFSTFLPSILKLQLGYNSMEAQYLTVPVYAVAALSMAAVAYVSDKFNHKSMLILALNSLGMIGYIILLSSKNGKVNYFATFLIAFPLYGSVGVNITWLNNNMAPHYRRATALGINQTIGNLAGIVAGQIYTKSPYKLGNSFSLGCTVLAMILVVVQLRYLHSQNALKERLRNEETEDKSIERTGSAALDYVYVY